MSKKHPSPAAIDAAIAHMMTQHTLKHLGDDKRMFPHDAHSLVHEAIMLACDQKDAET